LIKKQKQICAFAIVCGEATKQGAKSDEVGQALAFAFLKNTHQSFYCC